MYKLGEKFNGIHFSRREGDCMIYLLKGKTIRATAKMLELSPRTVEYYVRNMKLKVGCRTKYELIDLILDSDFLDNYKASKNT